MLAWTARQLRARARFGRSVLELETLPGVVGGYLAGTICVPALLDAPEGVRLELECVARTTAFPRPPPKAESVAARLRKSQSALGPVDE